MRHIWKMLVMLACAALLLTGCGMRTVDQLYCVPKRSDADMDLQKVIDKAMSGLSYSAPIYGENRQVTQRVDLDGDGVEECLVFAKDNSEQPLKILIFCQLASGYVLMDTIEGYGFAFDFVEYAQVDGQPGLEIIVGRQLSDQVMRSVSVYRFSSEISRQLMTASCTMYTSCDLDKDENVELLLLSPGESEGSDGVLSMYRLEDGKLQRTTVTNISEGVDRVKRVNIGTLADGVPAVFITSLSGDASLVTDIFSMNGEILSPVTQGEPVKALGSYYIYPEDIDDDGAMELPRLTPMPNHPLHQRQRYFLSWYSVDKDGKPADKLCTYTNLVQNWYLVIESDWMERMAVVDDTDRSVFYMKEPDDGEYVHIMTIYTLTDSDRKQIVADNQYTVLYEDEAVIYAVKLEEAAAELEISETLLRSWFHIMRTQLNTDEK